jgi:hypothetical protein
MKPATMLSARQAQPGLNTAATPLWNPLPGPQTIAYQTLADVTGYGGAAGGGKTDLALGLAITAHQKSLILRREAVHLGPSKTAPARSSATSGASIKRAASGGTCPAADRSSSAAARTLATSKPTAGDRTRSFVSMSPTSSSRR